MRTFAARCSASAFVTSLLLLACSGESDGADRLGASGTPARGSTALTPVLEQAGNFASNELWRDVLWGPDPDVVLFSGLLADLGTGELWHGCTYAVAPRAPDGVDAMWFDGTTLRVLDAYEQELEVCEPSPWTPEPPQAAPAATRIPIGFGLQDAVRVD